MRARRNYCSIKARKMRIVTKTNCYFIVNYFMSVINRLVYLQKNARVNVGDGQKLPGAVVLEHVDLL